MNLYHVTPWNTWEKIIRKTGLTPRAVERGIYSDSAAPRIYLFEDTATAEDALTGWLLEKFPRNRYFALLEINPGKETVFQDPEIAGSYYVTTPIPLSRIRLKEKIDAGWES